MLVERIDELSLRHHDFGGSANALLGGFVRRIDRLKAELIDRRRLRALGAVARGEPKDPPRPRSSTSSPRSIAPTSGCSPRPGRATTATSFATPCGVLREQPRRARRFEHVLIDDAQELDLAPATLALEVAGDAG